MGLTGVGSRARVLVTRRLAPDTLDRLTARHTVELHDSDAVMPRDRLLEAVRGTAAVLTTLDDRVDEEFLEAAGPGLRVVANHAVGLHNIDREACAARGVQVTNTPGVLTDSTADLTMALLLGAARRIGEGERTVRSATPWNWAPNFMLGLELSGAGLGILGMGEIGRAVARRARGFGLRIAYHNRSPLPDEHASGATWRPLERLLAESALLVVSCPLTKQTRNLLDARRLALLPTGAVVVSITAGVVDEDALAAALGTGALLAAAVDHHTHEPAVNRALLAQERALLTPHLGSATTHTRQAMGALAVDNVLAVLDGRRPPTPA
ncbi:MULTISPECIES: 2-hydroxyacid dehydrogenase [Streptomyces]|uniref:D-glycerate dehydrogenase n=2 Tax=Streptomyces hydrogenans TaxID=1873719 RepID=A0ABQ3PGW4_9ACTN|nr:D-glycerate dehydrogenase [Streptomyces hydrogenans]GHG35516.1 D-glycerate dehydrogenase [Streptomyces hydrogenans]GHI18663.1 D-glycerate dehydrogenase [Streptomyces hydrogenans]GHI20419.1 D-glycerate dehydrogenase [Streptomyces hydrogenans]GHI22701.1 D-glycerate dehydrogenase [Streptomyces hydrogenans]GHI22712.1 D-glycerate dehydrogenase [Streptomyces hydrogenans]